MEADLQVEGQDPAEVNPHYVDHAVASSAERDVQASEDILTGNGIKLLSKGAHIDAGTRDRLLEHKLAKPLEDCIEVGNGIVPAMFGPLAEELLSQHEIFRKLCAHERAQAVGASLSSLRLSRPVQSLLTLQADFQGERNSHSVGVAMLTLGLARRLLPNQIDRHRQLMLAALLHDVGELYIDPALLKRGSLLQTEQWRHIVSHPVIGYRVLRRMEGAGPAVAEAVLDHHERLDGFGYPRGLVGERFPLAHQILAVAEWLMALVNAGSAPLSRASVASRLVPGEFSPVIIEILDAAAISRAETALWLEAQQSLLSSLNRLERIVDTLERFQRSRAWIDARIAAASPQLRVTLELGLRRMLRIQSSFSSTGLDRRNPDTCLGELAGEADLKLHEELQTLIGEFGWRMRELERESLLRAGLLEPADLAVMRELVGRLRGERPIELESGQG